jgi:hypothetical protein
MPRRPKSINLDILRIGLKIQLITETTTVGKRQEILQEGEQEKASSNL